MHNCHRCFRNRERQQRNLRQPFAAIFRRLEFCGKPQMPTRTLSIKKRLLLEGNGQADLSNKNMCILKSTADAHPGLLLDFGKELQGGLQIVTGMYKRGKPITLHIRFGESASEAMSDVEPVHNATNYHAMRDIIVKVPWLGKFKIGNTGFRFVRIDLVDDNAEFELKEARTIFNFRDIPNLGSFHCSDTLLNKIWLTGAYTVQLNMQDFYGMASNATASFG